MSCRGGFGDVSQVIFPSSQSDKADQHQVPMFLSSQAKTSRAKVLKAILYVIIQLGRQCNGKAMPYLK
jgi:hypothetical protein